MSNLNYMGSYVVCDLYVIFVLFALRTARTVSEMVEMVCLLIVNVCLSQL